MPPPRMSNASQSRPTVVIAGATGLVGTAVREALADRYNLVALTRSPVRAERNATADTPETWRHCDLFSQAATEQAVEGADYAIYLVHSMLPSARLTQGTVVDLDVVLADNFAKAAAKQGIKQILYVGHLLPDEGPPSAQLRHRLEVERALASASVPVTAVRPGLIVGGGGTRLQVLLNLVRRLPMMVLPEWTAAHTQPIALRDVVRALDRCLANEATYGQRYDIGGPEVMTYRRMLERTADLLGLERRLIDTPVAAPAFSKLWVSVFGGAPWALVGPIVESLNQSVRVRPNPLQDAIRPDALSFEEALIRSVDAKGRPLPNPRASLRDEEDAVIRSNSVVRSVQRLPVPPHFSARDISKEYMNWLPQFGWPLLRCTVEGDAVQFMLKPLRTPLLKLTYAQTRSQGHRQLFYVTGGLLADSGSPAEGRLEFRTVLDGQFAIAAVHDFAPQLPWYVYSATQALAHLWVMKRFGHHLARLSAQQDAKTAMDEASPAWQ